MNVDDIVGHANVGTVPERAKALLESLPFKEVLTTSELAAKIGISVATFRAQYSLHPSIIELRCGYKPIGSGATQLVWGTKKTIAVLKDKLNKQ